MIGALGNRDPNQHISLHLQLCMSDWLLGLLALSLLQPRDLWRPENESSILTTMKTITLLFQAVLLFLRTKNAQENNIIQRYIENVLNLSNNTNGLAYTRRSVSHFTGMYPSICLVLCNTSRRSFFLRGKWEFYSIVTGLQSSGKREDLCPSIVHTYYYTHAIHM